jgi:hypothetical protein
MGAAASRMTSPFARSAGQDKTVLHQRSYWTARRACPAAREPITKRETGAPTPD